jgi:hypothetical protein
MLAFQAKVIGAKQVALDNITANEQNIRTLRQDLMLLKDNPSLLEVAGDSDKYTGNPLLLVANALPVGENVPAFGSNLTTLTIRLGDGASSIDSIAPGILDGTGTEGLVHNTSAEPISFTLSAAGYMGCNDEEYLCLDPKGLSRILWNLERSTRSIYLNVVTLTFREDGKVEMALTGNGFYTLQRSFELGSQVIRGSSGGSNSATTGTGTGTGSTTP